MKRLRPIIAILVIAILGTITYFAEREKEYKKSVLSGTFENLPTETASRTSGRVQVIYAEEGQTVKKGERLLKLDPGPLLTELAALKSQANEAELHLQNLQAGYRREDIAKQQGVVRELQAQVAMMNNGNRAQTIKKAQAQLAQAQANYDKIMQGPRSEEIAQAQAQLDAAQAQLTFARSENERYTNLLSSGAVAKQSQEQRAEQYKTALAAQAQAQQRLLELQRGYRQEERDMARAEVEQARHQLDELEEGFRPEERDMAAARLQQAQAQLELMQNGYRPQEIAQAKAALQTAKLKVQAAEEKLQEYIVTAPIDGVVECKLVACGDLVNAGTPLMRLSDPSDIWIKVYAAQNQLHLIHVNDKAQLLIDGYSELTPAHVEAIATSGEYTPINLQTPEERGRQVFALKLRLDRPDGNIKAGMIATVKSVGNWSDDKQ